MKMIKFYLCLFFRVAMGICFFFLLFNATIYKIFALKCKKDIKSQLTPFFSSLNEIYKFSVFWKDVENISIDNIPTILRSLKLQFLFPLPSILGSRSGFLWRHRKHSRDIWLGFERFEIIFGVVCFIVYILWVFKWKDFL